MRPAATDMVIWVAAAMLTATYLGAGCAKKGTFADDLAFLKKHLDVDLLTDESGQAQVAVVGAYQGRVMTSTAAGAGGTSFGWINRELIASGETLDHMNPYGGEDRLWIGPEGGQFSIYFPKGAKFEFENWQVPAVIDTEPFECVSKSDTKAVYSKDANLKNWTGTQFHVGLKREVALLDAESVKAKFGVAPGKGVRMVAYESRNTITNKGKAAWTKKGGLLSIWMLSMYNASPTTTVVIPFVSGPAAKLGKIVTDDYFGKVPAERLKVDAKKGVLFFKADARYRSKIGVAPKRAKRVVGSYDPAGRTLTLVTYTKPEGATDYVNSLWKHQEHPFRGDTVNSYSDGFDENGKQILGEFYEVETSSPAAALKPGGSLTHVHSTVHFQGPEADLDKLAQAALGVSLAEIKSALK